MKTDFFCDHLYVNEGKLVRLGASGGWEGFLDCDKIPKDLGKPFAEGHVGAPLGTGIKCDRARKETKSILLALFSSNLPY